MAEPHAASLQPPVLCSLNCSACCCRWEWSVVTHRLSTEAYERHTAESIARSYTKSGKGILYFFYYVCFWLKQWTYVYLYKQWTWGAGFVINSEQIWEHEHGMLIPDRLSWWLWCSAFWRRQVLCRGLGPFSFVKKKKVQEEPSLWVVDKWRTKHSGLGGQIDTVCPLFLFTLLVVLTLSNKISPKKKPLSLSNKMTRKLNRPCIGWQTISQF
jgi:hypothetical protein